MTRRFPLVAFTAAFFLFGAVGLFLVAQSVRIESEGRRQEIFRLTSFYGQSLHNSLDRSVAGSYALAALMRETHGKVENFDQLAPEISRVCGGVQAVEIVPDGIIRYVWPLQGNEKALGLNLFKTAAQRDDATLAKEAHTLNIAAPIHLVQGGIGICARLPVYLPDKRGIDRFWGFSEIVVLQDQLLEQSGIDSVTKQGIDFELRHGKNRMAGSSEKPLQDSVSDTFSVSNDSWVLNMRPKAGWYSVPRTISLLLLTVVISGALAWIVHQLMMRPVVLEREVASRTADLREANEQLAKGVAERNAAQQELAERERRFRDIFDLAPIGISTVDVTGRYVSANQGLQKILGYTESELLQMRFVDVTARDNPADAARGNFIIEQMDAGSIDQAEIEKQYIRKDGSRVSVTVTAVAVRDDQGKFLHTISLVQDVTEKRNMEARLRQSEKMEAVGTLAGGIAHDFNNILAAIRGNAHLLTEILQGSPDTLALAENIDRTGARAQDLVRQILTFSRAEDVARTPRLLAPMVEDAVQLLRATLPSSIQIVCTNADPSLIVSVTPTEIHRIMMNLATNAEAAMPARVGTFRISIDSVEAPLDPATQSATQSAGSERFAEITVADSGVGMEPGVVHRIFEPFFSTKEKSNGTGLGLSIIHGIVTSLGGSISVDSNVGKGTTFRILLPTVIPSDNAVTETIPSVPLPGNGRRVLFIDDEEDLVYLARRILTRLGYEVAGFVDSAEALQAFRASPENFDIVCCDITMPGEPGTEVATKIRAIREDIPIVLMSGFVRPEHALRAAEIGRTELVMKPDMTVSMALVIQEALLRA